MLIERVSDREIGLMRDLFFQGKYILVKRDSGNEVMPLFKPSIRLSDTHQLIFSDLLGYEKIYLKNYELSICNSLILINSPDCSEFDSYIISYNLGELEKSYSDMLDRRILKSIFFYPLDFSEFDDDCLNFLIELSDKLKAVKMSNEIMIQKTINLMIGSISVKLVFDLWNLSEYKSKTADELKYSLKLSIPTFNLELTANSLHFLFLRLFKELSARGVNKF